MISKALPLEARMVFRNDAGFSGGGSSPANDLVADVVGVVNDISFEKRAPRPLLYFDKGPSKRERILIENSSAPQRICDPAVCWLRQYPTNRWANIKQDH
jgi:hypothetical protein